MLAIYEDSAGILWFGTSDGIYRYDRQAGKIDRLPHNPPDPGDVKREIEIPVLGDRQGYLWLGTLGRGLSRYDPRTGEFVYYQQGWNPETGARVANTITDNYVVDILEDTSGRLWVGTQEGLNSFDRETGRMALV